MCEIGLRTTVSSRNSVFFSLSLCKFHCCWDPLGGFDSIFAPFRLLPLGVSAHLSGLAGVTQEGFLNSKIIAMCTLTVQCTHTVVLVPCNSTMLGTYGGMKIWKKNTVKEDKVRKLLPKNVIFVYLNTRTLLHPSNLKARKYCMVTSWFSFFTGARMRCFQFLSLCKIQRSVSCLENQHVYNISMCAAVVKMTLGQRYWGQTRLHCHCSSHLLGHVYATEFDGVHAC